MISFSNLFLFSFLAFTIFSIFCSALLFTSQIFYINVLYFIFSLQTKKIFCNIKVHFLEPKIISIMCAIWKYLTYIFNRHLILFDFIHFVSNIYNTYLYVLYIYTISNNKFIKSKNLSQYLRKTIFDCSYIILTTCLTQI